MEIVAILIDSVSCCMGTKRFWSQKKMKCMYSIFVIDNIFCSDNAMCSTFVVDDLFVYP